jgi:ketosteroid isomerase-like protein
VVRRRRHRNGPAEMIRIGLGRRPRDTCPFMEDGVELVRAIIEALNRGDLDEMLGHMHPDFEWRPLEASPVARVCHGHEQVRRYVEDWLGTFESLRLELEDPTQVADRVVAVVRGHGRGRASGVQLESRFCQVWTLRDGKAVAMEEHATREQALASIAGP